MANKLTPASLCEGLEKLFSANPIFTGKKVKMVVIANEMAGGFTQEKQSEKNGKILEDVLENIKGKSSVVSEFTCELKFTEKVGHGIDLAAMTAEENKSTSDTMVVFVSAGGDGTSREVQSGLTKWASESEENRKVVMNNFVVFRLPLGTGNDGTDGHLFDETLDLLVQPLHFANARAVKVSVSGEITADGIKEAGKDPADYGDVEEKAPWYAYNIASLGLSAFVCWKTNEVKSKHPGNHYSLMVDFAALNYNKAFPPEEAEIKVYKDGQLKDTINSAFEMIPFGVSGHRTFGGGKSIMPVDENVVFIKKLDVMTMVRVNKKFQDGTYASLGIAQTYQADKIEVSYDHPVLCELDGETHLLMKENFPVTMELTEPLIQVLEKDDLAWSRGTVRK